jgi:hypothetical protein
MVSKYDRVKGKVMYPFNTPMEILKLLFLQHIEAPIILQYVLQVS